LNSPHFGSAEISFNGGHFALDEDADAIGDAIIDTFSR
jgi:hypothetical protein